MWRTIGQRFMVLGIILFLLIAFTEKTALAQTLTEHCGTIAGDQFWAASSTHLVTCDLTVPQGVTLTVEAGAVVKFQSYTQLDINGRLHAAGTVEAPIYFTSYRDDQVGGDSDGAAESPAVGDWGNIQFRRGSDPSSLIHRAVIRYSGRDAGFNGEDDINDGAILLDAVSPDLAYITFEHNYLNAAELESGDWFTDTWGNETVIYAIEKNNLYIPTDAALTISPGVKIKLARLRSMVVKGRLQAPGSKSKPITFTALADDDVCGIGAFDEPICDTDGISDTVAAGNWGNIQFAMESDPESEISRAVIRYSGRASGILIDDGAIALNGASPRLSHISFQENYINGAVLRGGFDWPSDRWDNRTVVYVLEKFNLIIPADHELSIAPGVIIKFGGIASIQVDGTLRAIGEPDDPIHFTSLWDRERCGVGAADEAICDTMPTVPPRDAAIGDWGNVQFRPGSDRNSEIRYAVFRYSGHSQGDFIDDGALWLQNASPALSHITFEDNYINGAELQGNTEWSSTTLTSTSVVYVLEDGDITVPAGGSFALAPGVMLKLADDNSLVIEGTFQANGHAAQPITFTSIHDESVCGTGAAGEPICHAYGGSATRDPQMGDWGHIRFNGRGSDESSLSYADIRFSGSTLLDEFNDGAIYLSDASPTLAHISFTENYINGVELEGQRQWSTDTWDNTSVVYVLEEDDITVAQGDALTIAPGMRIKLGNGSGLHVNGSLVAAGTPQQPIYFASIYDDTVCGVDMDDEPLCNTHSQAAAQTPQPGDWGRITFRSGSHSSVLSHAVIRHSGNRLNSTDNSALLLEGTTPQLAFISFQQNETNGATLHADATWSGQTLDSSTVVYVVEQGEIVIPVDGDLTIAQDAMIKWGRGSNLAVNGQLVAVGDVDHPLYLTALTDDAVCGTGVFGEKICDTNGDGADSTPQPGDWGQLRFGSGTNDSQLIHAVVRYAGSKSGRSTDDAAILLENAAPIIAHSELTHNYSAIEVHDAQPTLICNDIYGNHAYGVYNATPEQTIFAEQHWWGSNQGPTHDSNAAGTGDVISDGVSFAPWARDRCITQIYSDSMPIRMDADLAVAFEALPETITPSSALTFSVVITNHGPGTSPGFVLDFAIPLELLHATELQFIPEDAEPLCFRTYEFTCMFAELESGGSVRVIATMTIEEMTPQVLHFAATVNGGSWDTNPANDSAAHPIEVRADTVSVYLPLVLR